VPRIARVKKSIDGIYHIIERGNEKKDIFNDDADRIKFLEILGRNKEKFLQFTCHQRAKHTG
jgi:putative transposase